MAILRNAAYVGVAAARVEPKQPIEKSIQTQIAQDQAGVYERLTDNAAEDVTETALASVNEPHDHTEPGNRIIRHLFSQAFGFEGGMQEDPFNSAVSFYQAPYTIKGIQSGDTPLTNVVVMGLFVLVTAADVDEELLFYVNILGGGFAGLHAAVYEDDIGGSRASPTGTIIEQDALQSSTTLEAVSPAIAEGQFGTSMYGMTFTPTAAGVYVILVKGSVQSGVADRAILSAHVVANFDPANRSPRQDEPPVSELYELNSITVGDPDNSNRFEALDALLVGADSPLHSMVTSTLNRNNAAMLEQATGLVVPGKLSITRTPHDHNGSPGRGAEIPYVHLSRTLGGFWGADTRVFGNNSRAPTVDTSGTYGAVQACRIMFPDSANTTGGGSPTSKLRARFLVDVDTGKLNVGGSFRIRLTIGANAYEYEVQKAGTNGLSIITATTAGVTYLTYTGGSLNTITLELKAINASSTGAGSLLAWMLSIEP